MTRLLILVFLSALMFYSNGQVVEERVQRYAREIQTDTFLIYTFPCSGGQLPFDSCGLDETHYLIWKQKGNYFIKKFEFCQQFKLVLLDTTNPLTFYISYKKTIDREEIKSPTYIEIKKTKRGVDTVITTSSINHSCYHQFTFHIRNKSVNKNGDIYDLDFAKFDNGRRNIYYDYNQRTKLKALIDIMNALLKQLDTDKKFEAQ